MRNMATQQEIDAWKAGIAELDAAIASPERQVTNGTQNVTYRTIDDLKKARGDLEAKVEAATAAATPRPKQMLAYYRGRGY